MYEDGQRLPDHEVLIRFNIWPDRAKGNPLRVKPQMFMPPPSGRLSVESTQGRDAVAIRAAGATFAGTQPAGKPLHGWAELRVMNVHGYRGEVRLEAIHDPRPTVHHAEIRGWPPAESKEAQKIVAMELANAASYVQ
jgi:hypothetical protein